MTQWIKIDQACQNNDNGFQIIRLARIEGTFDWS